MPATRRKPSSQPTVVKSPPTIRKAPKDTEVVTGSAVVEAGPRRRYDGPPKPRKQDRTLDANNNLFKIAGKLGITEQMHGRVAQEARFHFHDRLPQLQLPVSCDEEFQQRWTIFYNEMMATTWDCERALYSDAFRQAIRDIAGSASDMRQISQMAMAAGFVDKKLKTEKLISRSGADPSVVAALQEQLAEERSKRILAEEKRSLAEEALLKGVLEHSLPLSVLPADMQIDAFADMVDETGSLDLLSVEPLEGSDLDGQGVADLLKL